MQACHESATLNCGSWVGASGACAVKQRQVQTAGKDGGVPATGPERIRRATVSPSKFGRAGPLDPPQDETRKCAEESEAFGGEIRRSRTRRVRKHPRAGRECGGPFSRGRTVGAIRRARVQAGNRGKHGMRRPSLSYGASHRLRLPVAVIECRCVPGVAYVRSICRLCKHLAATVHAPPPHGVGICFGAILE